MRNFYLILFFISLPRILSSQTGTPVVITEYDSFIDLSTYLEIWEDQDGNSSIKDAKSAQFIRIYPKHGDSLFLGFSSSVYWVRFRIKNKTPIPRFLLELNHPVMDQAVLYQPAPPIPVSIENKKNSGYKPSPAIQENGYTTPFSIRDLPNRKIIFHLDDVVSDDYYYLKLSSRDRIDIPLKLWKTNEFYSNDHKSQFILGMIYGVIIFIILNNLVIYLRLRNKTYFYFSCLMFCVMMFLSTQNGVNTYNFIFHKSLSFLVLNTPLIIGISIISYLPFFRHYTGMKKYFPKLYRIISFMEWFALAYLPISQLISFRTAIVTGVIITLLYTITITYFSLYMTWKKNRETRQFSIAWSIFTTGLFFYILRCFGLIPVSAFSSQILEFGTAFAGIVFSLGLSGQMKRLLSKIDRQREYLRNTNLILESKVNLRTQELENKNRTLSEKTNEIMDSISYAQKLQISVMDNQERIRNNCPDFFVLWKPRDIVGGDFYWYRYIQDGSFYIAVVDCTGHGVPGAFMTIAASSALNSVLENSETLLLPCQILPLLHNEINLALHQDSKKQESGDGLDIGLCLYRRDINKLHFAGARISLFINGESGIEEIKGERKSLGYSLSAELPEFEDIQVEINNHSAFYMTSDGFLHQNGEEYKYPYGRKRFKQLLENVQDGPHFRYQEMQINRAFEEYTGNQNQRDDILVLGFKPPTK